jgi:predicted transcriptional regulator
MRTIKLMEEIQKEIEEYQRQKAELISILHYSTNVCRNVYQTLNQSGSPGEEEVKAMAGSLRKLIEKNNDILIKFDAYSESGELK